MSDRPYWCEICARKKECYGITLKPKCFVPTADRKTEPRKEQNFCGKCRYLYRDFKYGLSCYRLMDNEPCKYEERKTEPTISKMEQVEDEPMKTTDYCDICNHKGCGNCIANNLDDYCVPSGYEPKTQTETQNSNLTFETLEYCDICDHKGCEECIANALDEHCMPSQFKKQIEDGCAKEYEELGLKELKELIEADRKTENSSEKPNNLSEIPTGSEVTTDCRQTERSER